MDTNKRAKAERKKASDFPQELLNLLDSYVHGGIGLELAILEAQ